MAAIVVTVPQHLLRDVAPQVLGVLARRSGDFAAAEDAMQEALIAASEQWPNVGVPDNPRGWLYQVALRKLQDQQRQDASRRKRETRVAQEMQHAQPFVAPPDSEVLQQGNDSLLLLYMCCHPALTTSSAIALTLRAVGGLTTSEIARAFLVPEATMAQRISRAKATIKASKVPFAMPSSKEVPARLDAVTHVLYLIFNEAHTSTSGHNLYRLDLATEAIRLTRLLARFLPREREVQGLLALMLLHHARRPARTGADGRLVPLAEQIAGIFTEVVVAPGADEEARTAAGLAGPGSGVPAPAAIIIPPPRVLAACSAIESRASGA